MRKYNQEFMKAMVKKYLDWQRSSFECIDELTQIYFGENLKNQPKNLRCEKPSNLYFDLPWNRTFEADINFDLQCNFEF